MDSGTVSRFGMNRETATGKANSLLHTDKPQPGLAVHRFRVEADAVIFDRKAQNSADREEQDRGVLSLSVAHNVAEAFLGHTVETQRGGCRQ